ncbi:MAG: glucosamine-6-phosphate deaminase [Peptococcaceae bacterium]|nr:glucosamine-6-phosphate deaminase [Peptococcaceae bacterium]
MQIIVTRTFAGASDYVAEIIADLVLSKPTAKLGLATGSTPERVYDKLADMHFKGLDFSRVSTVNLDEYCGVTGDNPVSYRYYMNEKLFSHINVKPENIYVPSGINNPEEELELFSYKIYNGKIDLQLLGIGPNGHVGFNEPGDKLHRAAHITKLTQSTIDANARFFNDKSEVPTEAITMGMGDILSAASIVLLASGASKADAVKALLMDDYITTQVPATFIKMHAAATVVIDYELANMIGYKVKG